MRDYNVEEIKLTCSTLRLSASLIEMQLQTHPDDPQFDDALGHIKYNYEKLVRLCENRIPNNTSVGLLPDFDYAENDPKWGADYNHQRDLNEVGNIELSGKNAYNVIQYLVSFPSGFQGWFKREQLLIL